MLFPAAAAPERYWPYAPLLGWASSARTLGAMMLAFASWGSYRS
jgi:hypothetical protein